MPSTVGTSRFVGGEDGLDAQTRVVEDALDDQRAAQQGGDGESQEDDDRSEGVAEGVLEEGATTAAALRLGGAHVVLDHDLEHGATHVAAQTGHREHRQRGRPGG